MLDSFVTRTLHNVAAAETAAMMNIMEEAREAGFTAQPKIAVAPLKNDPATPIATRKFINFYTASGTRLTYILDICFKYSTSPRHKFEVYAKWGVKLPEDK